MVYITIFYFLALLSYKKYGKLVTQPIRFFFEKGSQLNSKI